MTDIEAATQAVRKHGTRAAAAKALGIPISTLKDRLRKAEAPVIDGTKEQSLEDLLKEHNLDANDWEPTRAWLNGASGKKSVELRRRSVLEHLDLEKLTTLPVKKWPKPKCTGTQGCMLEISFPDWHLGKLCWAKETGQDYDLSIAVRVFRSAVEDLLSRASTYDISKILIPIGNDLFQADNWQSTTAKGTYVDSVDDRFPRVFQTAMESLIYAVDLCREHAEIEFVWVPGNHDPTTSWYLSQALKHRYHNDKYVKVDDGPAPRKYKRWGKNLLGLTHGNNEKHDSLPLLMATECSTWWSECPFREFHLGHFHKKKEVRFLAGDEFNGVRVKILPSLSACDAWHMSQGYTGSRRAAEAYLYCPQKGEVAQFSSYAE